MTKPDKYDRMAWRICPSSSSYFFQEISQALRECAADAYKDAAKMGREDEIMAPVVANQTRREWSISVVESLCQMIDAKAAALRGKP